MVYIGIDPGKSGAMGWMNEAGRGPSVIPFDNLLYIDRLRFLSGMRCKAVIEKVNAMPGQGVTSMFNFGQNFGWILGVLEAYFIPYELVTPQKWKRELGVTSDKNTSIEVCKRLFPNVSLKRTERCKKDHDGMAEALLMAEYARRHMK